MALQRRWVFAFIVGIGIGIMISNMRYNDDYSAAATSASNLPWLFVVTPTYTRWTQKADLTRLSNTLQNIPRIHWIIVEDRDNTTALVARLLERSGVEAFTHLVAITPRNQRKSGARWKTPRGVEQRNAGIDEVVRIVRNQEEEGGGTIASRRRRGVVYFADDDNTYDLRLFSGMRWVQRVAVWPVGIVGGLLQEGPIIRDGHVIDWHTGWRKTRSFPIDMAGFAVNVDCFLDNPDLRFSRQSRTGYLETTMIAELVSSDDELETLNDTTSEILVWHTRTEQPDLSKEEVFPSDPNIEV